MDSNSKTKSQFSQFVKENIKPILITVIFCVISIVSLYYSIENHWVFIVSLPLTVLSVYTLSFLKENWRIYLLTIKGRKERERENEEKKLIESETKIFDQLSISEKMDYLKRNPDTIISDYVENYLRRYEKAQKYTATLRIEESLGEIFNDDFYLEINTSNYQEKLKMILENISDPIDKQTYLNESVLQEKIRLFTFFKIFDEDIYNIEVDLKKLKNGYLHREHYIMYESEKTLNHRFITKLKALRQNQETPFVRKSYMHVSRSGDSINMKNLIESHLIENYEYIWGESEKIDELNSIYNQYKLHTSEFFLYRVKPSGIDRWGCTFFKHDSSNDKKTEHVQGLDVFRQINNILENKIAQDDCSRTRLTHEIMTKGNFCFDLEDATEMNIFSQHHMLVEIEEVFESGECYEVERRVIDNFYLTGYEEGFLFCEDDICELFDVDHCGEWEYNGFSNDWCGIDDKDDYEECIKKWNIYKSKFPRITSKEQFEFN